LDLPATAAAGSPLLWNSRAVRAGFDSSLKLTGRNSVPKPAAKSVVLSFGAAAFVSCALPKALPCAASCRAQLREGWPVLTPSEVHRRRSSEFLPGARVCVTG
jgi:hypothetical protein